VENSERLDTWKAIADYLERHERTVKRWEAERGLPVHRLPGDQRSVVFAFTRELDDWLVASDIFREDEADLRIGNGSGGPLGNGSGVNSPLTLNEPSVGVIADRPRERALARWKRPMYISAGLLSALVIVAVADRYFGSKFSLRTPRIGNQQQLTSDGLEKRGLLTDGKTLYFTEDHEGLFALAAMPESGGPIRLLWSPTADVHPMDISPDGTKLIALTGGRQQYDAANITAHTAAWSPDGKTIAYSAGTRIYLTSETEPDSREIGSFAALPIILMWSQDGQILRFILQEIPSNRTRIWGQISGDRMSTTTLHSLPPSMYDGGFWGKTADGDALFVQGGPRTLASRTVSVVHYGSRWPNPAFQTAPMGSVLGDIYGISYSRESPRMFALTEPHNIATFIAFDPQAHAFRRILSGASGWYLDYSRDGKSVVYTGDDGRGLFISQADGSGIRQVVTGPEAIALPRWSPDGRQIAYTAQVPGRPWRVFILQLDSGAIREASEGSDGQGAPTWSPDGRFIVYGNVNCGYTLSCGIHKIDLATRKVKSLPDSEGLVTARWSPDGRFVAALHVEQHELMLFDVKDGNWHKLADAMDGADLSWSADSKYIYANVGGADAQIVRIRIMDGRRETVVDFRSQDKLDLAETDDLQFSLAPDDTVILHRRTHSEEIYAYELRDQ
jgi:Tol biopolymer transport system component